MRYRSSRLRRAAGELAQLIGQVGMLAQDAAFQGVTLFPGHGADVEGIGAALLILAPRRLCSRSRQVYPRSDRRSAPGAASVRD